MQNTIYRLMIFTIAAAIVYLTTKMCFLGWALQSIGHFVDANHDAVIAVATIGLVLVTAALALYTALLYRATVDLGKRAKESAEEQAAKMERVATGIAASANAASQSVLTAKEMATTQRLVTNLQLRAYVFAVGLSNEYYAPIAAKDSYTWRIRPQWQNSGATPTKGMTICTSAEIRDTVLPDNFDFPYAQSDVGTGLIAPRITLRGGPAPLQAITIQDIEDLQKRRKFLYLWGWAKYKDVFPDTPQHITKFCWQILALGNPRTFKPQSTNEGERVIFNYVYLPIGNCADEECESIRTS
jgi:hypothetical protein